MSSAAPATKEAPFVKAEIVKVDAARGKVTLKHENIPNLDMPAMTMVFAVADKKLLNGVKAGAKVRVKVEDVKGQATVTALESKK
jgi:Cu(I)/Ag(I) efflux system membrane protein CusA/SilA